MRIKRLRLAILFSILFGVTAARAESYRELSPALASARGAGKLVLVDVYAVWCAPCKVFTRESTTNPALAARLDDFVMAKIDGEKGEGIELVSRYAVRGYPTFLLLDEQSQLVARWYGWSGVDAFLDLLDVASAEPIPLELTRARHLERPTPRSAKLLAHDAYARGATVEAVDYFRELEALEPERSLENGLMIVEYVAAGLKSGAFDLEALDQAARPLLDEEGLDGPRAVGLARRLSHLFVGDARELLGPYLVAALRLSEGDSAAYLQRQRQILLVDHALIVENDKQLALRYRRELLSEGWAEDPAQLNAFAWWCFGEGLNLAEAEELASRGALLETEPKNKANILDTLAEIRFARGDAAGAVAAIEQAIEFHPSNSYLKKQRARFGKSLPEIADDSSAVAH